MAINSRAKGIRFERQLCQILTEKTGKIITRNWHAQTAIGGYDLEGLDKFAIEVKACKNITVNPWWVQTKTQAENSGRIPVLAYKKALVPWRFVVELKLINSSLGDGLVEMDVDSFVSVIKLQQLI